MSLLTSEHYLLHYNAGSPAERDIRQIAAHQEACFAHICQVLGVTPGFPIEYFLCDTPEEVGVLYGDNEACNGFAQTPDKVYAVYNDRVQCIGFHEDAHLISACIHQPPSAAVREGLAMFFDREWWGISNPDWTQQLLRTGRYPAMDALVDNDAFFAYDCAVTYPAVGAFTEYLFLRYGRDAYLDFYRRADDIQAAFAQTFGLSLRAADEAFVQYAGLFSIDEQVRRRMEALTAQ